MKKKNQPQEFGKPYTPKDFRDVGVGLFVAGIIALIFGIASFQNGIEDQIILTKVGNQMFGSAPHNPLSLIIAIAGGVISLAGLFFWRRGKKIEK